MHPIVPLFLISAVFVILGKSIHSEDLAQVPAVAPHVRRRSTRADVWPIDYRLAAPSTLPSAATEIPEDLQLLDIIVVASVDGKLHGLHRNTGKVLWSMKDAPNLNVTTSSPTAFDPLVRTEHSPHDSDRELFIIEPQSGEIYILPPMATPRDPLQRLGMSVQQLVEMSPFSFPGDEERVFVGRKQTSMMIVELETGRVKGTVNSERECFWDDQQEEEEKEEEIDLDELDGTKPPKSKLKPRDVHIGRTGVLSGYLLTHYMLIVFKITIFVCTLGVMVSFKIFTIPRTAQITSRGNVNPNGNAHLTTYMSNLYPMDRFLHSRLAALILRGTMMVCRFGGASLVSQCKCVPLVSKIRC